MTDNQPPADQPPTDQPPTDQPSIDRPSRPTFPPPPAGYQPYPGAAYPGAAYPGAAPNPYYYSAPPPPEFRAGSPYLPPPDEVGIADGWQNAPAELRPVVVLLAINLVLSVALTVVTIALRHSLVNYQLDHRHITDPHQREVLRDSYVSGLISRVVGNIVVSIVYAFIVRALLRGRRWAYRRVIFLGIAGIVGLLILQISPYPTWMRVEQLAQAVVLAALVFSVTRPGVKAHFAAHLPGRNVRRFNR